MATPIAPAGLRTAAALPTPRPGRWRAALLLAAAVGIWHAWLVDQLAPPTPQAGPPRPGPMQLRALPPSPAAAEPTDAAPGPPAAPAPLPPQPAAKVLPQGVVEALATDPAPAALPAAGHGANASAALHPAPRAEPAADTDAIAGAAGLPPPVYPTRLPAPARLHFALHINGQAGVAQLVWQHDGQRYRLTLDGQGADARALWMQASEGMLDADGLAPERFVDRRARGRTQAANLQREPSLPVGQIRYSGPPVQHPAWPGTQDRLSWLVQLVAILAAADAPPAGLSLFVTDARGHAGLWLLQRQPEVSASTPWGDLLQQHWLREPPQPEGLRVEVWLPARPDGPAGPWPLRLRMAVPRSGHVVELWRTDAP